MKLTDLLTELTASEMAHNLGLTYGGFSGWVDKNRKVVARTIDGKLVKVDHEEEGESDTDMGQVIILAFEDDLLKIDKSKPSKFMMKYNSFIKAIIQKGWDFVLLCNRGSEHAIADFLRRNGIKAGLKLVPIGELDPNKAMDFVKKKIEQGYTNIQYFDTSEQNCNAVDGLNATYNKKDELSIDVHPLTRIDLKGRDNAITP